MTKPFLWVALLVGILPAGCTMLFPDRAAQNPNPGASSVPAERPRLGGFVFPVPGAVLPESDLLMPNAPREYRRGVHRGVDVSYRDGREDRVSFGDPVVAMADARVVRADHAYQELTPRQRLTLLKATAILKGRAMDVLDALMGRQVWLLTPDGILFKYGHLSAIEPHVRPDTVVRKGEIIGRIGNSGMSPATSGSQMGAHLHFEIWDGKEYFGQGKDPAEVRQLYLGLFSKTPGHFSDSRKVEMQESKQ